MSWIFSLEDKATDCFSKEEIYVRIKGATALEIICHFVGDIDQNREKSPKTVDLQEQQN